MAPGMAPRTQPFSQVNGGIGTVAPLARQREKSRAISRDTESHLLRFSIYILPIYRGIFNSIFPCSGAYGATVPIPHLTCIVRVPHMCAKGATPTGQ